MAIPVTITASSIVNGRYLTASAIAEDYMDAVVDNPGSYASARVTAEDDDYGAGWLNPEETEIVFLALIPTLTKMTPEANAAIHEERSRHFQEMVEKLKEQDAGPTEA